MSGFSSIHLCDLTDNSCVVRSAWKQLSDVAFKDAEYNLHERQPHPKCLPGTRVNFLRHINELSDDGQGS